MTDTRTLARYLLSVLLGTALSWGLAGCSVNPGLGGVDRFAATTPHTFTEGRVYFLGDADQEKAIRPLLHPYEVNKGLDHRIAEALEIVSQSTDDAGFDAKAVLGEEFVLHNQPVSVVVNKVIIPPSAETRDVAVILDISTEEEISEQPLVVWYQRGVRGGDALNFENLIVYYDRAWDSRIAPYFHLRILDVTTERSRATLDLLQSSERLAASVSGLVPHPAIPGVRLAIEAGKQVVQNSRNTVLMDYSVQFYSAEDRRAAGGADLGYLRKGHWVVLGRNQSYDAEFWRTALGFDQQTLRIYRADEPAGVASRVDVPSVLLTVTTAESVVPTIVLDRSMELTKLLASDPSSQDFDAVAAKLKTLGSGVSTFLVARRVQREQTGEAMGDLFRLLNMHYAAKQEGAPVDSVIDELSTGDVHLLLLTAERASGRSFSSVADFVEWWNGGAKDFAFQFDATLGKTIWKR